MPTPNNAMRYYTRTSEALALDARELHVVRRPLRKTKQKVVLKNVGADKARFSVHAVITFILIFVCMMAMAFAFASTAGKRTHNAGLRAQLHRQEEQNAVLASEISMKYDINRIREIAVERLGLDEPKPHQIVYITVPKQSYTLYSEGGDSTAKSELLPFMETVKVYVERFLRIFQ